jgi:recombination protein RecA
MKMDGTPVKVEAISTGCMTLDFALGIGGIPRGRITEIYGPESSGKTTVALGIVAEAQKAGGIAAFIDAEHALDPVYAEKLGVNINELYISQPSSGEEALEICDTLVKSGSVDIIVIDSVAALTPQQELDGVMGQSQVGLQARMMSQALRKLTGSISKTHTSLIFINQLRDKVGVIYGSPEVTTGGKSLKFYASVRIDIRRGEQIKDGTEIVGNKTKAKVVKNKVAPPFRVAEFDIMYGKGVSKIGCLLDVAVNCEVVKKSGAFYSYEGEKLGQGREKSIAYLEQNSHLIDEIIVKVRDSFVQMPVEVDENEE